MELISKYNLKPGDTVSFNDYDEFVLIHKVSKEAGLPYLSSPTKYKYEDWTYLSIQTDCEDGKYCLGGINGIGYGNLYTTQQFIDKLKLDIIIPIQLTKHLFCNNL